MTLGCHGVNRFSGQFPVHFRGASYTRPVNLTAIIAFCGTAMVWAMTGCGKSKPTVDSGNPADSPAPWIGMDEIPLDPDRVLMRPIIADATEPTELQTLPDRAVSFVLDRQAGRVHVLDSRYAHDGRAYCIDTEQVSKSTAKGGSESCPEGTDEVQRGALVPTDRPVALAVDPSDRAVYLLTRGGVLMRADADVLRADPTEYLALTEGTDVPGLLLPLDAAHLAAHSGRVAVAAGTQLVVIDGPDVEVHELPGDALDIQVDADAIWVATDAGVWVDGVHTEVTGTHLFWWQSQWWLVAPEAGQVFSLQSDQAWTLDNITGPVAVDPRSDVAYLATGDGLTRLSADGTTAVTLTDASVLDVDINLAGEIIALHPDGALSVRVDETAYPPAPPLDVFITTFSERPRNPDDAVPCKASEEAPSIRGFMNTATANRRMLDDMPAPVGMGITAALASQAASCGEQARLQARMDHDLTSPGLLIHEEPSECEGDRGCHTAALQALADEVSGALEPTWLSGMSTHHELNVNWIASAQAAGLPSKYLFFGMSLRPDIGHHTDLRAKDAWPVTLGDMSRAWSTDAARSVADRSGSGATTIYPGDDTPAFNLGGCANLFLLECHPLLRGGGVQIDGEDTAVLDLLLHRAISQTPASSVRTWTFHLPDIGTYDFTDGCTEVDRAWSGEACAAAHLQQWLIDVDRRLVSAGLVRWTRPGDLEEL